VYENEAFHVAAASIMAEMLYKKSWNTLLSVLPPLSEDSIINFVKQQSAGKDTTLQDYEF
jgi:hypothetical protein